MIDGRRFHRCFRLLHDEHGLRRRGSPSTSSRASIARAASAKDAIYLRGFQEVLDSARRGQRPGAILVRQDRRAPHAGGRGARGARPAARAAEHPGVPRPSGRAGADRDDAQRDRRCRASSERNSNADRLFRQRHGARNSPTTRPPSWPTRRSSRGHRVCYITPGDFVLRPDDSCSVHARFAPAKKAKHPRRILQGHAGSRRKDGLDRHRARSTC